MLERLSAAHFDIAVDLLVEGFPDRNRSFWTTALATLERFSAADYPFGHLLVAKGEPVGVILTPTSLRRRAEGPPQRIVNLSSWYVRPSHRWRCGLMMKLVMADPEATYLDLTPTERVRQMLPALGFVPINAGVELSFLPVLALAGGRSGVVSPADEPRWGSTDGPDWSLIEQHRALDCVPLIVEGPAGSTRIVYKILRRNGLRVAKLVYVESHERLRPAIGRLSAYFLRCGCMFMRTPARDAKVGFGSIFAPQGVWYAKGGDFSDRTEILGSERLLFGI
ncbi:MAG: hypothetical protein CTY15_09955 [Methylocystis sp.]|nr:MAG: hypothetical protein CTY15_09955 [Methylocystis sp.]